MAIHLESTEVVGIVGAGAMGEGIAQVAAAAGHTVKLYDTRPESIERALASIRKTYQMLANKGKMTAEAATAAGARLQLASRLTELAGAKLIVEAIVENLEIKQQLFASLEDIVDANCILATKASLNKPGISGIAASSTS